MTQGGRESRADARGEREASPSHGGRPVLFSVIVCSRRRPQSLRRCLESLKAIDDSGYEIIVVDNHETSTIASVDDGVRVVHEPRPGLDFARNRGIAEANGGIVVFVDDDCEVEPSWLKALRGPFTDAEVSCVTGRVVAARLENFSERWFEQLWTFDRGPDPRRFVMPPGATVSFTDAGGLGTGCNMAYRKALFGRVGVFDEALDMGTLVGGGGDLDMFARVLAAGEQVVYEPNAIVYHHHRETIRKLARQLFGYGVAIGALSIKFTMEKPRRLRGVLAYQLGWLRWMSRRLDRSSTRRRAVASLFLVIAVAGDLCGPAAYALSRRRSDQLRVDRRRD